jgi:hypothetical protein
MDKVSLILWLAVAGPIDLITLILPIVGTAFALIFGFYKYIKKTKVKVAIFTTASDFLVEFILPVFPSATADVLLTYFGSKLNKIEQKIKNNKILGRFV